MTVTTPTTTLIPATATEWHAHIFYKARNPETLKWSEPDWDYEGDVLGWTLSDNGTPQALLMNSLGDLTLSSADSRDTYEDGEISIVGSRFFSHANCPHCQPKNPK